MAGSASSIQNLVLFVFLCISTSSAFSSFNGGKNGVVCNARERQALLKFMHALNYSANVLPSWVGEDCCSWDGVTCNNKTAHVIKLHLSLFNSLPYNSDMPFTGEIDPSLFELKHLTHLDLSYNNFGGKPIPKFFGLFKKLRYLNLSDSGFGGTIPPELGNLSSLRYLDLSGKDHSNLWADNLHWLSHLFSLQHLDMSSVNLSRASNWLQEINMLPSLSVLALQDCQISDFPTLPYLNFTSLTSHSSLSLHLTHLDLSYNDFGGSIPQEIGNLSSLHYLDLNGNSYLRVDDLHWLSHLFSLQHLEMSYVNLSRASSWLQEINMLPSLSVLRLSNCQLSYSSTLPNYMNFTSLTSLDLSGNVLSSEFLHWLFNLHRLDLEHLSSNNIKCPIPNALGYVSNLQKLYLSENKMDGDLNGFLQVLSRCGMRNGKMPSIRELDLSHNNFSGTLLESLGQLPNLEHLDVANNALEGVLSEAHFANLTRLDYLDLSSNSFVLNVGIDWIPPFHLKTIRLGSCHLGPRFPTWLCHQKDYSELDLSNAQISDMIPLWFWNLSSATSSINLSHNKIYGQIPNSLNFFGISLDLSWNLLEGPFPNHIPFVMALDLSNNLFSGTLIINIPNAFTFLHLSKNHLNGSIPSSICEGYGPTSSLQILDLSDNGITGQIPSCFIQLHDLDVLDLSKNQLSGEIPIGLISYTRIKWLRLSYNNFSGGLPSSFGIADNFRGVDLSENSLSGSLPAWNSKNVTRLRILNLRANMFHGNIPEQLSQLPSLQFLDLSHNRLLGNIPTSFGNFKGMKTEASQSDIISHIFWPGDYYVERMMVVMKGIEREYTKTLRLVAAIDLSRNDLSGAIPEELTSLYGLKSLNLSGNQLEGKIPESIGKMRQLESLDLSRNHLFGAIPASMEALSFLGTLNLSYNNLSGQIPPGNHLQTLFANLSTSMGNRDLCGPPLAKTCQEEVPQTPATLGGGAEEEGVEKLWFFIGMAPGFVIGFWCIFGPLLFSKSWRIAYYKFFDNSINWLCGSL